MEIKIKTEKDFCDCKSCREEIIKGFSEGFRTNCVKGEFKVTDNENKVIWEILNTELNLSEKIVDDLDIPYPAGHNWEGLTPRQINAGYKTDIKLTEKGK